MPWRQAVTVALVVAVVGLCFALHGSSRSHISIDAGVPHDDRIEVVRTQQVVSAPAQPASQPVSVSALRDAMLASSLLAATPSVEVEPLAAARAELDTRLASAAPNPARAAQLEQSLRPLLKPSLLGETVAELVCGASLCRVNLIGEDDPHVGRAVTALSENLPKTFAGLAVYPESAGHKAVYLATTASELQLGTETPKGAYNRVE